MCYGSNQGQLYTRYSLGDGDNIEIVNAHMEEASGAKGDDWGTNVTIGDDLYPEHIRNR